MQKILVPLILAFFASGANAQKPIATPTPEPTRTELKLEKIGTITAVSYSLKNLPAPENSFKSDTDGFSIRLPRPQSSTPAVFPPPGEMPKPGRTVWNMQEAEMALSIVPIPPGLIASWTKKQFTEELLGAMERSIQAVSDHHVIYQKEIEQGGLTGREAKILAGKFTLVGRWFMANDRQYMIVAQFKDPDTEALVKNALDTFEITKK